MSQSWTLVRLRSVAVFVGKLRSVIHRNNRARRTSSGLLRREEGMSKVSWLTSETLLRSQTNHINKLENKAFCVTLKHQQVVMLLWRFPVETWRFKNEAQWNIKMMFLFCCVGIQMLLVKTFVLVVLMRNSQSAKLMELLCCVQVLTVVSVVFRLLQLQISSFPPSLWGCSRTLVGLQGSETCLKVLTVIAWPFSLIRLLWKLLLNEVSVWNLK